MVIGPSFLTQPQLDKLREYVFKGKPVMLMNSAMEDLINDKQRNNPYRRQQQNDPASETGDLAGFYTRIGVNWDFNKMVWESYQPHPEVNGGDEMCAFVNVNSGASEPFNKKDVITKNLQEVVFLGSGPLDVNPTQTKIVFTPLLRSSKSSGVYDAVEFYKYLQAKQMGFNVVSPSKDVAQNERILAARYTGTVRDGGAAPPAEHAVNLIVTGDYKCITNQFFAIRQNWPDLSLDNVTFVFNCIDSLAGDDSLIDLRNRRPKHRTLTALEKQTEQYNKKQIETDNEAKKKSEETIKKYQTELEEVRKNLSKDTEIGAQAKATAFRQELNSKQNELEAKIKEQEKELKRKKNLSLREKNKNIKAIQNNIRSWALMFSPLPAMLIGALVVLFRRVRNS